MQTRIDNQPYFTGGTPGLSTDVAPTGGPIPRLGELGHVYLDAFGQKWQRVKAAGTLTQAAAASNVFYWVAGHAFVVDTDYTDSEATANSVAGVFGLATGITSQTLPVANQLFWALQAGPAITFNGAAVNFLAGMVITPTATVGVVTGTAALTAPPAQKLGTVHTPVDRSGGAGTVVVDADIDSRAF